VLGETGPRGGPGPNTVMPHDGTIRLGLTTSWRTNGADTYGGERYLLDAAMRADLGGDPTRHTLVLDFDVAYHPSRAWDPRWVCPLVAPENRLDIPVRGGEQLS